VLVWLLFKVRLAINARSIGWTDEGKTCFVGLVGSGLG